MVGENASGRGFESNFENENIPISSQMLLDTILFLKKVPTLMPIIR